MSGGVQEIADWLLVQSGAPKGAAPIDRDQDLFESGVLSSLQVMELIVMIEQASGKRVDRLSIGPGDLNTIDQIEQRFFDPAPTESEQARAAG
ncbi:acyl carrier protein [Mangrovihabitans endophyticus]|uniref:Carrier domain-containing protein n=1 Tax=Mangrovihabitans endophyticus TaxID=1751298 RepID=A0A8J3FMM0_9ACTN|nr:acyl carrier protein [Mangrovihabitans endophyticus]GGK85015.1 hypothetical protein GCM10012284_19160 [Mangrovihabitans endophyticus]